MLSEDIISKDNINLTKRDNSNEKRKEPKDGSSILYVFAAAAAAAAATDVAADLNDNNLAITDPEVTLKLEEDTEMVSN